jgi:hypothetical protein
MQAAVALERSPSHVMAWLAGVGLDIDFSVRSIHFSSLYFRSSALPLTQPQCQSVSFQAALETARPHDYALC